MPAQENKHTQNSKIHMHGHQINNQTLKIDVGKGTSKRASSGLSMHKVKPELTPTKVSMGPLMQSVTQKKPAILKK
jgi:hypothetical protein